MNALLDLIPKLGSGVLGVDPAGYEQMTANELFQLGIADLTLAKDTPMSYQSSDVV